MSETAAPTGAAPLTATDFIRVHSSDKDVLFWCDEIDGEIASLQTKLAEAEAARDDVFEQHLDCEHHCDELEARAESAEREVATLREALGLWADAYGDPQKWWPCEFIKTTRAALANTKAPNAHS